MEGLAMREQGVRGYLMLIDPASLEILWANDNVEAVVAGRSGGSAVGRSVTDVIPFAAAMRISERLRGVALTGETDELQSLGVSVAGERTRTDASIYRMPSGELLLASEYSVVGPTS